MKKRLFQSILTLALAVGMVLAMSVAASAEDSSVTFNGNKLFVFRPGSAYTETDLFDNFKGVMPGDKRTQEVTVENQCGDFDYVKIYMRAESPSVANIKSVKNPTDETVRKMNKFLAQMYMKVYQGGKVIYEASPDKTDGLTSNVKLGEFKKGESTKLRVELTVPKTLSNEFAYNIGEVDWVFTVEGVEKPTPNPNPNPNPTPNPTPKPTPIIKTGDNSNLLAVAGVMGVALLLLVAVLVLRRKKSK